MRRAVPRIGTLLAPLLAALWVGVAPAEGAVAPAAPGVAPQEATMPGDTTRSIGGVRFSDTVRGGSGSGPTGEELDALTAKVAEQLRCPVCRNQSVVESSATLSQQMQAEIRRRLAAGQSPEEVRQYFVSRYGEWILLQPKAEGINLLVYILPALALLGGLVWVGFRIRRWTRGEAAPSAAGADAPVDAASAGGDGRRAGGRDAGTGDGPRPPGDDDADLSERERRRLDELIREER